MTFLLRALGLIGWRGAAGAALGAVLAAVAGYQAGRLHEGAATQAKIEAALSTHSLRQMERAHDRLLEADRARRAADRERDADGGMPDDGFRRE